MDTATRDTTRAVQPVRATHDVGPAWRRPPLSVDERIARGKEARQRAPRTSHAQFVPATDRPDPVALIEEQAQSRVPELVPIRHGRMLASPFAFYRGAALIMAGDLAATPRSGIAVQCCGDAHLSNFGVYGTPERQLVFDVNDFDETLPGPWEWDVKRLAASFEVCGRQLALSAAERRDVVIASVREYRSRMRADAGRKNLDVWYDHFEAGQLLEEVSKEARKARLSKQDVRAVDRLVTTARKRDSSRVLSKRASDVDGQLRITADPPLVVPLEDVAVSNSSDWDDPEATIKKLLSSYRRTLSHERHPIEEFRYVHAARKVVGVGSVGTRCYIMLLVGRDNDDPLFLQIKEAQPSVLERFIGKSRYANCGERVVVGQRVMQAASDIFLGWQRATGLEGVSRDFYVRQLHDWKGSADVEKLDFASATFYARLCGATLARAHARWGDRIAIAGYLGNGDTFDRAIADFAAAYADCNDRDYERFSAACASGRLPAETGV